MAVDPMRLPWTPFWRVKAEYTLLPRVRWLRWLDSAAAVLAGIGLYVAGRMGF